MVPDYVQRLRLDGRAYLVVGAGRGIGRQTAHALSQAGAVVACLDSDEERSRKVAQEVQGVPLTCDAVDRGALESAVDGLVAEVGPLHGIVDIVGMARFQALADVTDADWDWQMGIVVTHARYVLQIGARVLADTAGSMVFVSSVVGLTGAQGIGSYGAAKAALISLVRTASVEFASAGIRVNSVAPSVVLTPRMSEILTNPDRRSSFVDNVPLGRLAEESDVAGSILFLCSPLSGYITGQTLVLDGGVQARLPYPDFV